ncbi:hypothetical protein FRC08_000469 [Ceratobasidium sp. 394]|nr:hypothetical protein FRC08_000469 [Ceratobasidium sp. 394]
MGAAAYTRSNGRAGGQSGSSSGTGTSRTSRSGSNVLGLGFQRGPLSPLGQSYVSAPPPPPVLVDVGPKEEPVVSSKDEPAVDESASPKDEPSSSPKETPTPSDTPLDASPTRTRAPRPKIHISNIVSNNLPMSSPGAGPGPRTMESSPRIVATNGFPSPRLSGPSNNSGFPSPRLAGTGNGFPSPGLGLSGVGFPSPGLGAVGSGGAGGFPFGPGRKGSLTAGMGVALANRGD